MTERTIAIGDIHGCSKALDTLLEVVGPHASDTIIPLGDYIDRGPDSRGVLDRLIDLARHCRLIPILGNHDQLLLDVRNLRYPLDWLIEIGGGPTLDSYGPGRDLARIPGSHYAFLEGCRDYHETETHIFIHANYVPELPLNELRPEILRWESLKVVVPGPHVSGKTVIVGHSSQKSGEILDLGYLKCIDTFCHGGKWLTALEAGTGEVWQTNQKGEVRSPR